MNRFTHCRAALAITALALAAIALISFLVFSRAPGRRFPADGADQPIAEPGERSSGLHTNTAAGANPGAAPAIAHSWPEPTPFTRHLIATLTNLDFTQGPITEEQAAIWKHTLQRLTEQGPEAVPAIHEFLSQNRQLDFTSNPGGNLLGQSSLRSAMINALSQIGGPDATAALLEALHSTTLPTEIPQLAQALDEQSPGEYSQQILKAVTDVLTMAAASQLPPEWDVAPLFKLVQAHGDSSTAAALQQFEGHTNITRRWPWPACPTALVCRNSSTKASPPTIRPP